MIFRRYRNGPVLLRTDVPPMPGIDDPSSVFNPGAVLIDGITHLLVRVQTRGRRTFTVPARSETGRAFACGDNPVAFTGFDELRDADGSPLGAVHHIYDARITAVDGDLLVVTALDTDRGCRLALWRAAGDPAGPHAGLERLEFVALTGADDTRNGVLFPERVGGDYLLLDRPNRPRDGGPTSGDVIELHASRDLKTWRPVGPVMGGRPHFWDELIGAGPPPVKTRQGWLLVYHGVATHFQSVNIYQAGAVLLDLDDPTRVIGRTPDNILEPRRPWELQGQVPNVVFPGGMTVFAHDADGFALPEAKLNLYYGAADTCVGLATTSVGELLAACRG
jgi:predicted GH43/DUF377 family glycosyl hydrolase